MRNGAPRLLADAAVTRTNVVASSMLWGGNPRLLLQALRERRVELYTSTPLLAELTDILGRSKFETKIAAVIADGRSVGRSLCGVGTDGAPVGVTEALKITGKRGEMA